MTQKEAVLKYMKRFGKISSYDACLDLGVIDLPKVISELRLKDNRTDIAQRTITKKNRYGHAVNYAEYWLI